MQNEEQVFDFMAAAEETGKQLDEMAKRLPDELRTALTEEWRKSPWLAELPQIADQVTEAAERAETATADLRRSLKIGVFAVVVACMLIPLATWAVATWQVSELERKAATLQADIEALTPTADALKAETGGGVILQKYDDGAHGVILPGGYVFSHVGKDNDGREVMVYRRKER